LSVTTVALFLAGVNVLLLLVGGALIGMVVTNRHRLARASRWRSAILPWPWVPLASGSAPAVGLGAVFLTFLKFGAVVYGSGYVLLAFLRPELVTHLHWLTDRQLVDAVSVGQVTPGPVFTTATFIGYLVAGTSGAVAATVAIFLPSFVLVAVAHRFLEALGRSPWMQGFLRGASAAALGLMAGVTVLLGKAAIVDWFTALIAVAAVAVLVRFRINAAWVVLGGALLGVVAKLTFA
jgi:chromate transporter